MKDWFSTCDGECSACPKTRIVQKCADDLEAASDVFKRCNDGEFPTATVCSCATDFKAKVTAGEAACGSDYTNKLTEIGFSEAVGCTPEGLKLCSPYENKLINNYTDTFSDCQSSSKVGEVTKVGKLCDCIITLQNNIKTIKGSCVTYNFLNSSLKLQYDVNQCSKNAGKDVECDDAKLKACTNGIGACTAAGAGNIVSVCPCYAEFSKCLGKNADCPTAFLTQNTFYMACKALCPATTNCGPEGVMFTFDPTLFGTNAPTPGDGDSPATTRVEFVTGPGGATVTDSKGQPVTRIVSVDDDGNTKTTGATQLAVGVAAAVVVIAQL